MQPAVQFATAVNADRAAVARAACCAGPCRSPCAADRGQFRTAAAACKAAAPTTAVRVRPPPPPSRQRRAPERHRARSPRARFRFRGLFAPAGTPAPIVAKMNKDATEIISTADVAFDITWIGATQPERLPPLAATVGGRGGCQQPRRGTFLRASLTAYNPKGDTLRTERSKPAATYKLGSAIQSSASFLLGKCSTR